MVELEIFKGFCYLIGEAGLPIIIAGTFILGVIYVVRWALYVYIPTREQTHEAKFDKILSNFSSERLQLEEHHSEQLNKIDKVHRETMEFLRSNINDSARHLDENIKENRQLTERYLNEIQRSNDNFSNTTGLLHEILVQLNSLRNSIVNSCLQEKEHKEHKEQMELNGIQGTEGTKVK